MICFFLKKIQHLILYKFLCLLNMESLIQWFQSGIPDDQLMLGISQFWWNRIAKVLQFTGALMILIDIIGIYRINIIGKKLKSLSGFVFFISTIKKSSIFGLPKEALNKKDFIVLLIYILCFFLVWWKVINVKSISIHWKELSWYIKGLILFLGGYFYNFLVIVLLLILDYVFIKPIQLILSNSKLKEWGQIFSISLIAVDFFIDMMIN